MRAGLAELDRVLRGEATQPEELRDGVIRVRPDRLLVVLTCLGAIYGLSLGCYSLVNHAEPNFPQLLASTVKVPLLFLLTLIVTFPSLYVFNALVGSRLRFGAVLRLLVVDLAVTLAVLASLGPIVGFFGITTTSYPFISLLNVVAFAVAGSLGMIFLLQTLNRLVWSQTPLRPRATPPSLPVRATDAAAPDVGAGASELPTSETGAARIEEDLTPIEDAIASLAPSVARSTSPVSPSPLDTLPGHPLERHVKAVFHCWAIIFALVGAQMGWVLRPFVGSPDLPFSWFRPRQSNFFEAVTRTIWELFFG